MEELRSTDILDKEIQNDAQKKAEEILASGKKEAEKILAQVAPRLENDRAARVKACAQKEAKFKKDMDASVPLEKQRFLVSFIAKSVNEALNEYLKNLSQDERLKIVLKPLVSLKESFAGQKFSASVYGFSSADAKAEVEKILGQKLVSCKEISPSLSGEEEIPGIELREGVILESEDAGVKCRLTLEEAINELKDNSYKELVDALFGGRL